MNDTASADAAFFVDAHRRVKCGVVTDDGVFLDDNMGVNLAISADLYIGTDVSKSADVDVFTNLSAFVNEGRLFNDGFFFVHAVVERQKLGKTSVGIGHLYEGECGWKRLSWHKGLVDNTNARACGVDVRLVFWIGEKAQRTGLTFFDFSQATNGDVGVAGNFTVQ